MTPACQDRGIPDLLNWSWPRVYSSSRDRPARCTVGGAGNAIFLVTMYALSATGGVILLAYTAYCFFVVVDDTTAGLNEVIWPGEPAGEWFIQGAILAWLVLVWLAP